MHEYASRVRDIGRAEAPQYSDSVTNAMVSGLVDDESLVAAPGEGEAFFSGLRSYRQHFQFIQRRYGLTVVTAPIGKHDIQDLTTLDRISLPEAISTITILREELGKYPPSYIRSLNPDRVRLAKRLVRDESFIDGLASSYGHFYVAISHSERWTRRIIHHEVSHLGDFLQEQRKEVVGVGSGVKNKLITVFRRLTEERRWKSMNPNGGKAYEGDNWRQHGEEHAEKLPPGFVRAYGLMEPSEDRATIYELLMTDPHALADMAKRDPVLQRKVERIKLLLEKRTRGLMNQEFFTDFLEGSVTDRYWGTPEIEGEEVFRWIPADPFTGRQVFSAGAVD